MKNKNQMEINNLIEEIVNLEHRIDDIPDYLVQIERLEKLESDLNNRLEVIEDIFGGFSNSHLEESYELREEINKKKDEF